MILQIGVKKKIGTPAKPLWKNRTQLKFPNKSQISSAGSSKTNLPTVGFLSTSLRWKSCWYHKYFPTRTHPKKKGLTCRFAQQKDSSLGCQTRLSGFFGVKWANPRGFYTTKFEGSRDWQSNQRKLGGQLRTKNDCRHCHTWSRHISGG